MCHVCTVVAVWTVILCQCRWCEFFESWTRSEPGSSKGYYKQLINCILFISKPLPFLNRTLICKTIFMISTSASILEHPSILSSKNGLTTLENQRKVCSSSFCDQYSLGTQLAVAARASNMLVTST